jgi:CRP/FNR family transcriptional regulator, cyclic AMP receptor protein
MRETIATAVNQRAADDAFELALSMVSTGKSVLDLDTNQVLYSQGDKADAVFYLQRGTVKQVVVSFCGKEATLGVIGKRDFCGLSCLQQNVRLSTATTLEPSLVTRVERDVMLQVLRDQPRIYEVVLNQLLDQTISLQKDLCDQILDPSEKRLARVLLKLSRLGEERQGQVVIPRISHDTLASMVGTTRSRITYFMGRFKKSGMVDYGKGMVVHPSRLTSAIQESSEFF